MTAPTKDALRVYDAVCQTISILQTVHLARTSATDANAMWGNFFMPDAALETAINILIGILEDVETLPTQPEA